MHLLIHALHELARWFGRYACMHTRIAQRRLDHASAPAIIPVKIILLLFPLAVSQGQPDSHFFFSCFHGRAGGEDGCVYKLLLFLSSRHHALAITARQLTTLTLAAS